MAEHFGHRNCLVHNLLFRSINFIEYLPSTTSLKIFLISSTSYNIIIVVRSDIFPLGLGVLLAHYLLHASRSFSPFGDIFYSNAPDMTLTLSTWVRYDHSASVTLIFCHQAVTNPILVLLLIIGRGWY